MDRETAAEFVYRIEKAFSQIQSAVDLVNSRIDGSDRREFASVIGEAICELDLGVLEVIYHAHPDLRPAGMVQTIPLGRLEPRPRPDGDQPA